MTARNNSNKKNNRIHVVEEKKQVDLSHQGQLSWGGAGRERGRDGAGAGWGRSGGGGVSDKDGWVPFSEVSTR